jgi:hypothetical protein
MENASMEGLLLILVLAWFVGWIYENGYARAKRVGSRKGYGVGYHRGRRHADPSGCLLFVAAILALGGATIVMAAICR